MQDHLAHLALPASVRGIAGIPRRAGQGINIRTGIVESDGRLTLVQVRTSVLATPATLPNAFFTVMVQAAQLMSGTDSVTVLGADQAVPGHRDDDGKRGQCSLSSTVNNLDGICPV